MARELDTPKSVSTHTTHATPTLVAQAQRAPPRRVKFCEGLLLPFRLFILSPVENGEVPLVNLLENVKFNIPLTSFLTNLQT